jgi:hypothetical protein
LWEIRHEEGVIKEVLYRFDFLPVDVYKIGNALESKEGYSNRKYDFIDIKTAFAKEAISHVGQMVEHLEVGVKHLVERIGEEIGILEVGENGKIEKGPYTYDPLL